MHALCDGVHDVLHCAGVKMSSSLLEAWRTRTLAGGRYSLEKERSYRYQFQAVADARLKEMLVGSDRCLGEMVSEMQAAVETSDPEDGQFTHLFNELKGADAPFAKQCLEHYSRSLAGPPNRPTRDKTGAFQHQHCTNYISSRQCSTLV
eukprot:3543-Heterococcus_DN1.PRE.5